MKLYTLALLGICLSTSAFSAATTCETYAAANNLPSVRVVNPATDVLTDVEKGMIQTTILVGNPGQPMTLEQAIAQFTDAENDGSNGGSLVYSKIKVGNRTRTVVRATYYPGDNEYGVLFQQTSAQAGIYVDMLGTIQDGDIVCLSYQN